jgi:hypothetical protein
LRQILAGCIDVFVWAGESLAGRIKHMHDRAALKAVLAEERVVDSMDWICGYDPVTQWDKPPVVPAIE